MLEVSIKYAYLTPIIIKDPPMFQKYHLLTLAFIFTLNSCSSDTLDPSLDLKGDTALNFSESKELWLEMKQEQGDDYQYTIHEMSWTGAESKTTSTIEKGNPVSRNYVAYVRDQNSGEEEVTDSYLEAGAELGSHEIGARPLTIDELYETCVAQFLSVDEDTNTIHFETDEQGILNLCGYVEKGCIDDCFKGITMSNFNWL